MHTNDVWREAKDDMGRSIWINMSLACCIRRDPKGRCTLVTFDKEHTLAVDSTVNDLMSGATRPAPTKRPRDFDVAPLRGEDVGNSQVKAFRRSMPSSRIR